MNKAFIVSTLLALGSLAHAQQDCYSLRQELRSLEDQRSRAERQLDDINREQRRTEDQINSNRIDLGREMDQAISRARSVSSECGTNISRGFSNPTDQSVRTIVNGEEVNSRVVCEDRGYNDPYCINKKQCLDVAYDAENTYNGYKREQNQLQSRLRTLQSREHNTERDLRSIERRIDDVEYQLRTCRG